MHTRIEQITIHEAGHALASLEAGHKVTALSATYDGGSCRFDDRDLAYTGNLFISLAGIAAEELLCGKPLFSNHDDLKHARAFSDRLGSKVVEQKIQQHLYKLHYFLDANRDAIQHLTSALRALDGTLSEPEIAEVVWATESPLWKYRRLYASPKQLTLTRYPAAYTVIDRCERLSGFLGARRCHKPIYRMPKAAATKTPAKKSPLRTTLGGGAKWETVSSHGGIF